MRIAFFISEDWYALSHRRSLLAAAVACGHEVHVLTHVRSGREELEATGAAVTPIELHRSGRSVRGESRAFLQIVRALRRLSPDLLHNVALKPILYGTAAAKVAQVPHVVNALAGMGSLFGEATRTRPKPGRRALRRALATALRAQGTHVVIQNPEDREQVRQLGVDLARVTLIRGAGIDMAQFSPQPEPRTPPVVVRFLGRLLWTKGLAELHDAAVSLAADSEIVIEAFGQRDEHNPDCVDEETIATWRAEGALRIREHSPDVSAVMAGAHIIVLPSHREGLPRVLLEAAAAERSMIASDVPGCREVVHHGRTGLLVPVRDPTALAEAIRELAADPRARYVMARTARAHVAAEMTDEVVNGQMLALYGAVVNPRAPARGR